MAKQMLVSVDAGGLNSELKRLDQRVRSLEKLCGKISARSGRGSVSFGRKRPRNDMNLVDSLAKLLRNKTQSVTDIAANVQKAGYKTTSPNFRTIVNQTLINNPAFKRVSRGKYTVKANYNKKK